jgi:hypothetical protein
MAITERRPTLTDCGCEVTVYADGSGIELHYCPMHQAAKELLEALIAARGMLTPKQQRSWPKNYERICIAIKAAGG